MKGGLDVCGEAVCPGWAYCAFHMQRLLTPEGIEYGGPAPNCHEAIAAHAENVPRPVARDFQDTAIPAEIWTGGSSWNPPGPRGMQIISMIGGMRQYLQMERLLLATGLDILEDMLENQQVVNTLYIRISGYQFPNEIDTISDVVVEVLDVISQRQRTKIDVWLDIASGEDKWHGALISNADLRRVQHHICTANNPIQNAAILWNDSVRYRKLISMNGCTAEEMRSIQYLDLVPTDPDVDLLSFTTELPNSVGQQ